MARSIKSASSTEVSPKVTKVVPVGDEARKRSVSAVSKPFIKSMLDSLPAEFATKTKSAEVKLIAEAFVKALVDATAAGESTTFTNLFTFKRARRDDRTHKNPRDSTPIFKPAHYVMTMEVKPQLKLQFGAIPIVAGEVAAAPSDEDGPSETDVPEPVVAVEEPVVVIEEAVVADTTPIKVKKIKKRVD